MAKAELLKTAKPILFNTEMVQAILDGRKTETRRVLCENRQIVKCELNEWWYSGTVYGGFNILQSNLRRTKAKYHVGDILYVRETFAQPAKNIFWYKADYFQVQNILWKPSIHMPKEAARIFLKVTNVRVERLQDITADGIRNEGLTSAAVHCGDMEIASAEFAKLWDSTLKKSDLDKYGWDANPWVWVYEFERIDVND